MRSGVEGAGGGHPAGEWAGRVRKFLGRGTSCAGAAHDGSPSRVVTGKRGVHPRALRRSRLESRVQAIGTSGSMSGDGKRSAGRRP